MAANYGPYQPYTGFNTKDPNTGNSQDLGQRYITKSYLLDVYPNLASATGNRTAPGLWTWGTGTDGVNTVNIYPVGGPYYSSPVQIGSLTNWKQVSAWWYNNAAIKTDGTLWTWGASSYGGLGVGNTLNYSSPIQVGALTTWKQVSAGTAHMSAVKTDGTLWAWGLNSYGQLGDSTVVNKSSPVQVGALTTWKQVVAGNFFTFAIRNDGTLWAWGWNTAGQLGNGAVSTTVYYSSPIQVGALTTWKQVAIGYYHTAAVKVDGTLWTWGYNNLGQLGNGNITSYSSPIQIGTLTNWKQVACNDWNTYAIKTDGTLWAWGNSGLGALGDGTTAYKSSPVQIGSLTNWKKVVGGSQTAVALKTDGTIWGWGNNAWGELGVNASGSSYYSSPIQIGSLTTWKSIASGWNYTLAIQDGFI
jgi:alpha-tubulin suppressor-like RCC1 family protein